MSRGKRREPLNITRGDDYSHVITIRMRTAGFVNITGRTFTSQLRKVKTQTNPDATFTCVVTDGVNGQLTIYLSHTDTQALTTGCYFWDLQQSAAGVITTIVNGTAEVALDVTR